MQRPWTVSSRPPLGAHDVAEALQGLVGDDAEDALEVLYTHHASLVFNVALRVTRSRAAAEEVTQAVFLELWHRPDRFDPARSSLRSWLATVSHSRSTEWVRPGTADDGASGGRGARRLPGVEETVAWAFGAERADLALAELGEEERIPIRLAYFGARNCWQVARDLGVPERNIKHRIRMGLQQLASALQADRVSGVLSR